MIESLAHTFSKTERLCGKTSIAALVAHGRWGSTAHIKYCVRKREQDETQELNRIMIGVPKKFFKRAVKRNLLKRRLREAYRTQKNLLTASGLDLMFSYSSPEIADYAVLREEVASILVKISK